MKTDTIDKKVDIEIEEQQRLRPDEKLMAYVILGSVGLFFLSIFLFFMDNANVFNSFWHAVVTTYMSAFFIFDIYILVAWLSGEKA